MIANFFGADEAEELERSAHEIRRVIPAQRDGQTPPLPQGTRPGEALSFWQKEPLDR